MSFLKGVLPPFGIAALVLGIGWRMRRSENSWETEGRTLAWAPPLAFGLAYLGVHVGTHGWPDPGYLDSKLKILAAALAAGLVGFLCVAARPPAWLRIGGEAALCLAVPWFLIAYGREEWASQRETLTWLAGLGGALFVVWRSTALWEVRHPGPAVVFLLVLWTVAAIAGLLLGRSASYAQLAGGIAAAGTAAWLLALTRRVQLGSGGIGAWVVAVGALLLAGVFYAYLPLSSAALLLAAPLSVWISALPPLAVRSGVLRFAILCFVVAVPCGIGLYLAWRSGEPSEYSPY